MRAINLTRPQLPLEDNCGLHYVQCLFFFFFNDTATTEIYTLSLHDALPIFDAGFVEVFGGEEQILRTGLGEHLDRKSTRLNSSHQIISYAVFCLKKKKIHTDNVRSTTTSENGDDCKTHSWNFKAAAKRPIAV